MCWLISVYSGTCLYLSKASSHSASFIGGSAPMMGFHSVMLRPLPVRRVMPPMATMQAMRTQPVINQRTTGRRRCVRALDMGRENTGGRSGDTWRSMKGTPRHWAGDRLPPPPHLSVGHDPQGLSGEAVPDE